VAGPAKKTTGNTGAPGDSGEDGDAGQNSGTAGGTEAANQAEIYAGNVTREAIGLVITTPPIPTPAPTPAPTPTPTPTPVPPSVTAVQVLNQTVTTGHGKHAKKTTKFVGFELTFNEALNPAGAQNSGNDQLFQSVKKGRKTTHKPVGLTASYNAANHTVSLLVAGKPAFTTGGGLVLTASGITDTAGDPLSGPTTFTISAHARGISG
jgi:hypothetical protein